MKKDPFISDISKKIIDLSFGDKVNINAESSNKPEDSNNINLKFENKQNKINHKIKIPLYEKIYNFLTLVIYIIGFTISLFLPAIVCIKYTLEAGGYLYSLQNITFQNIIITSINISKFFLINFLYSLIVFCIMGVILIILFVFKFLCGIIEDIYLQKNIKKNYNLTKDKLKELDEAEAAQKNK
jgi:hypothetical protein